MFTDSRQNPTTHYHFSKNVHTSSVSTAAHLPVRLLNIDYFPDQNAYAHWKKRYLGMVKGSMTVHCD